MKRARKPIVSAHAWSRWRERFPGQSMIAALEEAKPVSEIIKMHHHVRGDDVQAIATRSALFVVRGNLVITVFRRKTLTPSKHAQLQAEKSK